MILVMLIVLISCIFTRVSEMIWNAINLYLYVMKISCLTLAWSMLVVWKHFIGRRKTLSMREKNHVQSSRSQMTRLYDIKWLHIYSIIGLNMHSSLRLYMTLNALVDKALNGRFCIGR